MAALTSSSFAFILHLRGTSHKFRLLADLHRSPPSRRRQRLSIDASPTDKHRRPRMASSVVAGTPSSGQTHCLEMGTPLRTCRAAPWMATLLRRTAVLALQLQNHRGESLSHYKLIVLHMHSAAAILILFFRLVTPQRSPGCSVAKSIPSSAWTSGLAR